MLTYSVRSTPTTNLNRATQDVYETLRRLAHDQLICQEKAKILIAKSGYCRSTVQRAIKVLQQHRYISIEHRFDRQRRPLTNYYRLL
ncbi:MAG: hypothetical protein BWK78_06050 [Thiotrichaceae bacterium IS1]|nr:MAG: hypothetical protein BWK78_06050 [Thiotrichaceae bacterium IS1]